MNFQTSDSPDPREITLCVPEWPLGLADILGLKPGNIVGGPEPFAEANGNSQSASQGLKVKKLKGEGVKKLRPKTFRPIFQLFSSSRLCVFAGNLTLASQESTLSLFRLSLEVQQGGGGKPAFLTVSFHELQIVKDLES